jgi:monovalent cation:proton antiporter-2 (CPA2) family protein
MHPESMLTQAVVYLAAAVVAVPVAKRLGLGSVLGYLLAGVVVGPDVLGLLGDGAGDVRHVAEFGVVLMLFLVGLELQPSRFWALRRQLFGLGAAQVVGTTAVIAAIGWTLGWGVRVPLAAGVILAMSSTAIVLQSLQERGQLQTSGGEAAFSVLLFQDLAVIPILALLPLLAAPGEGAPAAVAAATTSAIARLPGWLQTTVVIGAVAAVVAAGRYLVNPLFRLIARTELRELFTAAALLLVVGVSLAMQLVGLSAALGTFLAGVVLANSEYRHELEADIEPFKGLLLGLFFISVGAGINFGLVREHAAGIAGLVVALLAVKTGVLFGLGTLFQLPSPARWLFSLALAQGGEFAFVLLTFAVDHHVLTSAQAGPLLATIALSMALTPLLFVANDRWIQPRFARPAPRREPDAIEPQDNPVIIAGFGRFGHVVGRLLRANGLGATVLDLDAEQVEIIRRLGIKVFYGDATRLDLLHAAGAAKAKIIVIAIDSETKSIELAELVQRHFPHLKIYARAVGRVHAYEYQKRGILSFYRETLGSSLDLGADVLHELGLSARQAHRAALLFKRHDEHSVRELARFWEDDDAYFKNARQDIEAFERMFASDAERPPGDAPLTAPTAPAVDSSRS